MADLAHTEESLKRENETLKRAYQKLLGQHDQLKEDHATLKDAHANLQQEHKQKCESHIELEEELKKREHMLADQLQREKLEAERREKSRKEVLRKKKEEAAKERDHLAAQRSLRWTRKMDKSLPAPSCDDPANVYGESSGKMRRNTEAWNTFHQTPGTELKDGVMLKKTRTKGWEGLEPSCDDRVSVYGEATQNARARLLEEWNSHDQGELKDGHLLKQNNKNVIKPSCDNPAEVYGDTTGVRGGNRGAMLEEWNNLGQEDLERKDGVLLKKQNKDVIKPSCDDPASVYGESTGIRGGSREHMLEEWNSYGQEEKLKDGVLAKKKGTTVAPSCDDRESVYGSRVDSRAKMLNEWNDHNNNDTREVFDESSVSGGRKERKVKSDDDLEGLSKGRTAKSDEDLEARAARKLAEMNSKVKSARQMKADAEAKKQADERAADEAKLRAEAEASLANEAVPEPIQASEVAKEQGLGVSAEEKRRQEEAKLAKAKAEKQATEDAALLDEFEMSKSPAPV